MIYYVCIVALLIQTGMHLFVAHSHKRQWVQLIESKDAEWKQERQQLLDRIQASSFAEYKTQEVRVIKAQNGEKEPPKLEQL